jgi:hypothetical protein
MKVIKFRKPKRFAFDRLHPDDYAELTRLMKIIGLIGFDRLTPYEYKDYHTLMNHIDTWRDKEGCVKNTNEEKGETS